MAGWGKDGSFYKDNNELRRADNRWLQQEEQRKALEKQNRIMQEQNQAMEYQNRLIEKQMYEQREKDEEQRVLEIRRQIELEEQTKIQKERFFIDNLSEIDKERYQIYKQTLDSINRTLNKISDIEYRYINEKEKLKLSLGKSLTGAKNIGGRRLVVETFVIFIVLVLFYVIVSVRSSLSPDMIVITCFGAIFLMIVSAINYMIKHHKTNKKASIINKDIKKLMEEINKLGLTDNIDKVEYVHQIGLEGVTSYGESIQQCSEQVLEIVNRIEDDIKKIEDGINQITDTLNSIYKKNRKVEE